MDFNNTSHEQFLKNVNDLKVRDAKKRMGIASTNNLYSSSNDGILSSEGSSTDYIRDKIWL